MKNKILNLLNKEVLNSEFTSIEIEGNNLLFINKFNVLDSDEKKYAAKDANYSLLNKIGTGSMIDIYDWTHLFRYFIVAGLVKESGMNILDIGCASGVIRRILRRGNRIANFNYVGLDINKNMLKKIALDSGKHPAALLCVDLSKNWNYLQNNKFDFVIAMEIIEHLRFEQGLKFLKRCRMKMKDSGVLVFSTPQYGFKKLSERTKNKLKFNDGKDYYVHHLHEYTREELEVLFEEVGLEIHSYYGYGTQISVFEENIKNKFEFNYVYKKISKFVPKPMIIPLLSYANPEFATFVLYILRKVVK